MKTRLILKNGQRGAKRLTEKYGDNLLYVRFRYDADSQQRFKTIELIVERTPWAPPHRYCTADQIVGSRINPADMQARSQVKTAVGKWDPEKKLWFIQHGKIAGTALEKHIQVMIS